VTISASGVRASGAVTVTISLFQLVSLKYPRVLFARFSISHLLRRERYLFVAFAV